MDRNAQVILVENSSAGRPPITFAGQAVEIVHEPDTISQGVDGHISVGRHPSTVLWFGGTTKDLTGITNVKIVGVNGSILVEGEINTTYGAPSQVDQGVKFFVY
jgi:hypothetical protein